MAGEVSPTDMTGNNHLPLAVSECPELLSTRVSVLAALSLRSGCRRVRKQEYKEDRRPGSSIPGCTQFPGSSSVGPCLDLGLRAGVQEQAAGVASPGSKVTHATQYEYSANTPPVTGLLTPPYLLGPGDWAL